MVRQDKSKLERWLDRYFEPAFFGLRHIIMIAVVFAFLGAVVMFLIGAIETWSAIEYAFKQAFGLNAGPEHSFMKSQISLIKSIDAFLMGLVLMIFSYGVYDLFISKLDPADKPGIRPNWLKFEDVGGLKMTLAEVVLIILIITFFELVLDHIDVFQDVWTFLVIPIGVLFIAVGIAIFEKFTRAAH